MLALLWFLLTIVILGVVQAIGPLKVFKVVTDVYRPSLNYHYCKISSAVSNSLLITLTAGQLAISVRIIIHLIYNVI